MRHHRDEARLRLVGLFRGFLGCAHLDLGGLARGGLLLEREVRRVRSRSVPARRCCSSVWVTAWVMVRHRLAALTWSFTR